MSREGINLAGVLYFMNGRAKEQLNEVLSTGLCGSNFKMKFVGLSLLLMVDQKYKA